MPTQEVFVTASPRILKRNTCPSLSGRSELTYHIGCDETHAIYLQLAGNTGTGKFNADWVALSAIEALIGERSGFSLLTSVAFRPLFQGKSRNSPSFLLAVLLSEAIVIGCLNGDDGYLPGDVEAFKQAMTELIASEPSIVDTTADKPAKKKPVGRKPSGRPTP